ncbi:MAG TPA: 30S ribosomal protein S8 [Terriglobales bacterium]|nr:30S ribosomal protein S8 [Terriglobales bacterium]
MNLTDPVADLLTRIRNAVHAHQAKVDVPASKLKLEIVRILRDEGYISDFKLETEDGQPPRLRVFLKYDASDQPVISDLQRVSKPGCRVYVGRKQIRPVLGGMGINILSTPRGVMTGREARQIGIGGELLCEVW